MTTVYLGPNDPNPTERHVTVVIHRDHVGVEKGYFFDSAEKDLGGSGPFDWRMAEAIEKAERLAADRRIPIVAVRAKRD
jgi:hypothetical protein